MILAIDLGGTKLQYGLYDSGVQVSGEIVQTQSDFVTQLKALISDLNRQFDGRINGVAIGVPGPTQNNVMQGSRPLNYLEDLDFSATFAEFKIPFVVKNDLNMAAFCELFEGAGKQHKSFCLVSLSTGIGIAVINDGKIMSGRTEMGHQILDPNLKPAQNCTNHSNCWVSLASGSGIVNRFATAEHKTTEAIFKNVLTKKDLRELKAFNAQALGNIVNAYDPEVIVIMGSLGLQQFDTIIPDVSEIENYTINRPIPKIIKTQTGSDIGVVGSYYAAKAELDLPAGD